MEKILEKNDGDHLRIHASRALWEVVFDEDTPSFLDYYYQYKAAKNEIDIDDNETDGTGGLPEKGGMLEKTGMPDTTGRSETAVSMVHWNPYMLHIGSRKPGKGIRPGTDTITDGDRDGGPEGEDNRDETSVSEIGAEGVRVPYIVGVATLPEFRHQGRMAKLLCRGLRREARRGTPFVWLIPADGTIYEPFSFRYVGRKYIITWDKKTAVGDRQENRSFKEVGYGKVASVYETFVCEAPVRDAAVHEASVCDKVACEASVCDKAVCDEFVYDLSVCDVTVSELQVEDDARVSSFLNRRLSEVSDVFAIRGADYIADARAQFQSDGGGIAAVKYKDAIEGYFSWWPEDGILKLRELVLSERLEALGRQAQGDGRRGSVLEAKLRSFFSDIARKRNSDELKALAGGRIEAVTTGWAGTVVTNTPVSNVMVRIADVKSFLELFRSDVPCHIRLRVRDEIVEGNNRTYGWTVDAEGSRVVMVMEAEDNNPDGRGCDVVASPEDLVGWLFGEDEGLYRRFPHIQRYSRIHLPECV
jgi:hypothetical protein